MNLKKIQENVKKSSSIIMASHLFVKAKIPRKAAQKRRLSLVLLFAEALAVSTLILGGIALVGTDHNPVQGTVVLAVAVVGALIDSKL